MLWRLGYATISFAPVAGIFSERGINADESGAALTGEALRAKTGSRMENGNCPNCGYDLREHFQRGSDPVVCSECGESIRVQDCAIPKTFVWRIPILCVLIPQGLAGSSIFGLRGDFTALVPLFVLAGGVLGVLAASIIGAARAWCRIGQRASRGKRIGWMMAALFENGVAAGVTAFVLMFPISALVLIWRDLSR